jgi:UDP-N-acetylmuramyl pentapeptide phosphotransferase/UDP-N-acetylglucosamine-1-phosphate transferase
VIFCGKLLPLLLLKLLKQVKYNIIETVKHCFCKTDTVSCFGVIIYITLFPMTLTCWQLYENMENVALVLVFSIITWKRDVRR